MTKRELVKRVKKQVPNASDTEIARVTGTSISHTRATLNEDRQDPSPLRRAKRKSINRQKK